MAALFSNSIKKFESTGNNLKREKRNEQAMQHIFKSLWEYNYDINSIFVISQS